MTTNYRDHLGNYITTEEWKIEADCPENCSKKTEITKDENEFIVSKRFCGTNNALFKIYVDCSEELTGYFGFKCDCQNEADSETEYQRIIEAIENDVPLIIEETENDEVVVLLEDK